MTGVLPKWLEQLFGIDSAGSGEGTAWTLKGGWGLPPWMLLLLVIIAVAVVVQFYLRETGTAGRGLRLLLAGMRLALVAIVAFMLAQFVLSLERTGLPYVVVVVDDSGSMKWEDRYDDEKLRAALTKQVEAVGLKGTTRLNLAKSILLKDDAALLHGIENRYKLKVYFLSDSARAQSGDLPTLASDIRNVTPTGGSTRLGDGIRTVLNDLRGTPPTAVIVLSDGITTEGETLADVAAYAKRNGVPLHTVAIGSETPIRDLEVTDLAVDPVVFVDDVVSFQAKLTATGYGNRHVELTLHEKDRPEVLARVEVAVAPDGKPQTVRLPYRPTKVGEFEYVLEAKPLADEVRPDNNSQRRIVSVRKEQIKVLLVQSYANYEFRYLRQMLERDSTISLKTVLQEADVEYASIDKAALRVFPIRRQELFEYDCLIFGDVDRSFLSASALSDIEAFVKEKGNGVIFIAGPLHTPLEYRDSALASLFPVDLRNAATPNPAATIREGFAVEPTLTGRLAPPFQLGDTPEENAEIWQKLPRLFWVLDAPAGQHSTVWATGRTGDGRQVPVITTQQIGRGRVVFHGTDETWRWRFRVGDIYFARYWVQTIRFLTRTQLLGKDRTAELKSDRTEYGRGQPAQLTLRFDGGKSPTADDGVTVVIEHEGSPNRRQQLYRSTFSPDVFEASLANLADGNYHVWVTTPAMEGGAPSVDFKVVPPLGEFERLQVDAAELRRASDLTKGRAYTAATAGALLADLPKGRQVPIEALPPIVLWNRWPLLFAFLTLVIGEWVLRKYKGML
jgi:hypothetical protein